DRASRATSAPASMSAAIRRGRSSAGTARRRCWPRWRGLRKATTIRIESWRHGERDAGAGMDHDRIARIIPRLHWRLMPTLLMMYVLAFLDRANVGFAREGFAAHAGIGD